MIGPEGTDNCHKFVDILGLRTIFPLFMKSPKKIKKVGTTEKEHEGGCASDPPYFCGGGGSMSVRLQGGSSTSPPLQGSSCCWEQHACHLLLISALLAIPFHVLVISYFTPVGSVV